MTSEGWETTEAHPLHLNLQGQTVETTRAVMYKDGKEVIATYTFTDGEFSTGNLSKFQMVQLLRRFRAKVPIGALVRVIVPVSGDRAAAEQLSNEFITANLPTVLRGLRSAHIRAN